MIDEAILKKLEALGIKPGDAAQWVQTRPFKAAELPTVQRQQDLLLKLKEVLQAQLETDAAKLDRAREDYERAKNGGGV